jgi:hypothetical protein
MKSRKRPVRRKALPLWAIVAAIAGAVIILTVIFLKLPGENVNLERTDPEAAEMARDFYEQCKDAKFFQGLRPNMQKGLVKTKKVPPEWGEGNYVPYYDAKAGRRK